MSNKEIATSLHYGLYSTLLYALQYGTVRVAERTRVDGFLDRVVELYSYSTVSSVLYCTALYINWQRRVLTPEVVM